MSVSAGLHFNDNEQRIVITLRMNSDNLTDGCGTEFNDAYQIAIVVKWVDAMTYDINEDGTSMFRKTGAYWAQ
jgi:hypothetical protein